MRATGLPIDAGLSELLGVLSTRGDAVLVAPPGSGKTTVVPLALAETLSQGAGRILVLEPRRLATRAAARRMASILGEDVGETVGYRTRDDQRVGPKTRIEVMTEGVLTRRLQRDAALPGVAAVLFDEVHERNLQTDVGLAFCLDARATLRPDLMVLAMSATLDAERFAELIGRHRAGLDQSPSSIVRVDGRPFPVDVRWIPRDSRERIEPAVAQVVLRALNDEPGDVLVFLPGVGEIGRTQQILTSAFDGRAIDVYPLAGSLSNVDQDTALAPSPPGRRRVVLATDIAETSLTVEGVRIVVDAGQARVPRFDQRTGLTRLRTVTASRSSADQRAGRAGRVEPGVAYRLWRQGEHSTRPANLPAELTQVELSGFALDVSLWGTAVDQLALIDKPPTRTMSEATTLLTMLGALHEGRVTPLGEAIANLPVHPRLGRMLAVCRDNEPDSLWTACILATLVDERDVLRGRPDELPGDVAIRLRLVDERDAFHPLADNRAVAMIRSRARDLANRLGASVGNVHEERAGRLLALAYPDRLAFGRNQPGRFQLRSGTGAWVVKGDALAAERFVIAADLDGDRREARIRLGAALAAEDVAVLFANEIEERVTTGWDRERDELLERVERRLGGIVLDVVSRRPQADDTIIEALLGRVRESRLAELTWSADACQLRGRVGLMNRIFGEPWPDWSDDQLLEELDVWLAPFLLGARGKEALVRVDMNAVLRARLDPRLPGDLDRVAPHALTTSVGRRIPFDYGDGSEAPRLAARVQDLFGMTVHPRVCDGRVDAVIELLSPAGRPIQITADLPGFWAGSWAQVRKEMAGRYPKHAWPVDAANAQPPQPGPGSGGKRRKR